MLSPFHLLQTVLSGVRSRRAGEWRMESGCAWPAAPWVSPLPPSPGGETVQPYSILKTDTGLSTHAGSTLQGKSHLCIPFLGIARPQSQLPHSCVCERFIYSLPGSVHIFPCSKIGRLSYKYINLSQIYECRNRETEHYNSVFEVTVSFLGIQYINENQPFILDSHSSEFGSGPVSRICSIRILYGPRLFMTKSWKSFELKKFDLLCNFLAPWISAKMKISYFFLLFGDPFWPAWIRINWPNWIQNRDTAHCP